jgi:hypothetical protein
MFDDPENVAPPVSREHALSRAKYWISKNYDASETWQRNESKELTIELAMLAVYAALNNGDASSELDEKLKFCLHLVSRLTFAGQSVQISDIINKSEALRNEAEKITAKLYHNAVWRRYNVSNSFQEGRLSHDYYDGGSSGQHIAADYLSRPWARHGMIDWILLDMMITRETCLYGESVKIRGIPGVTGDYFKHNGNLSAMRPTPMGRASKSFVAFCFEWVIPIAAIWYTFDHGYQKAGYAFLGLFAVSLVWWIITLVIRFGLEIYWYASGKEKPTFQPLRIMRAIDNVWHSLTGPVVNPSMVKAAMSRAAERGAVWDGAAWSIIDRAIAIDAAVMVTTTKTKMPQFI